MKQEHFASGRWGNLRLILGCLLGTLLCARSGAAPYYESNGPYCHGTGGACYAGVDVATGSLSVGGDLIEIPGRIPISLGWQWRSQDNSNGPIAKGTSLTTDYFVTAYGGGYELLGPGNRHFLFPTLSGGDYINTTDPEMLGARLTVTGGGLTSVLRWKDGGKFLFDSGGALYRVEDPHGNYLTITRNASGYPTQISQPNGRSVTLDYDATSGKLLTISLWDDSWAQFIFHRDLQGRLDGVMDRLGMWTNYTWTSYQRGGVTLPLLASVSDQNGNSLYTNAYDSQGRLATRTYPDAGVLTMAYSGAIGSSGYTTATDPLGNVTRWDFLWNTSNGALFGYNVTRVTDPMGEVTQFQRTGPSYLVTSIIDYRNRTTTLSWDHTRGNLLFVTRPTASGGTMTWGATYDPTWNAVTTLTDPLNRTTTFTVDPAKGDVTAVRDAANFTTTFTYDAPTGDLLSVTNPLNQPTQFTYSPSTGDLLTITDPAGHQTALGYNGRSLVTLITDANGKQTSRSYNRVVAQ